MLKIGHRGASGSAPENTITAFCRALALGADGVELDVHRMKSGELAVIHDDTVDRTTNGTGNIAEMTAEQLRTVQVRGSLRIPTLGEVLVMLQGAYCFIEIKHDDAALLAMEQMRQATQNGYPPEHLWLISFHLEALKRALVIAPWLNVGASFDELKTTHVSMAYKMGAKAIIPNYRHLEPEHVKEAHSLGLKVICWTANEPADIERLTRMGVDGIMSDYPERLGTRHEA